MDFSKQNILIIEDNIDTLNAMIEIFECIFYKVYSTIDGYEVIEIFKNNKIDVILCDIKMPNLNGLEIIENIRKYSYSVPIIIISAYNDSETLFKALNSTIQGYINKPLTSNKIEEVLERIYYHQNNGLVEKIIRKKHSVIMDLQNSQIFVDNKIIKLTYKEAKFIKLLLEKKNQIVSYEIIEQVVWYDENKVMTSTSIRTLVKNIRKKIIIDIIQNIPKSGYKLIVDNVY